MSEIKESSSEYGTRGGDPLESRHREDGATFTRRTLLRQFLSFFTAVAIEKSGLRLLGGYVQNQTETETETETEPLPSGIISREELLQRFNIVIHDLPEAHFPTSYVELNFRRSAQEERVFEMLEEGRLIGMDIILVDSDIVDPNFFTAEQNQLMTEFPALAANLAREFEKSREINRQEIEENRQIMMVRYHELLGQLNQNQTTMSLDRYQVELQALHYSYDRYISDQVLEIDLTEIAVRGYSPTVGTATNSRGQSGPRNFVFLAVRDSQKTITFTSGSETKTIPASRIPQASVDGVALLPNSQAPQPDQSRPNQSSLIIGEVPNRLGYLILGGRTPGTILRHEFQHSRGIPDETEADRRSLQRLQEAADYLESTGSDEKYFIEFRTPEGVTVTQNPDSSLAI